MIQTNVRPNLVFSDLDGTLFRGNATRLFVDLAHERKFLDRTQLTQGLVVALLSRPLPLTTRLRLGWATFARLLANKSYAQYQAIAAECADFIVSNLYAEVAARLEQHRAGGAKVILISASPEEVVRRVAESLQFSGIEASQLERSRDGARLTGRTRSPICYGAEKVRRAQLACRRLNGESATPNLYNLGSSAYYADDLSDYYLLAKVGQPVTVNPHPSLQQKAHSKNWEILLTT